MGANSDNSGTVHGLIDELRAGHITRRRLLEGLTALGITGAAATLIAATGQQHPRSRAEKMHFQLHDVHVQQQVAGNTNLMMNDYADDAVVEDPLFSATFVGKAAISQRYAAEVASVPDRSLSITNRVVQGDQLVVEWVASGTHVAPFLGIGGNGQHYTITGVTVVTRSNGKITRESHFFDTDELLRQIAS